MVCRCSQMRWGSSFLKDTESWTKDDQSIPVPGTVWFPTKCGTGSKDCSKVRLKCWMVLGYTFSKTRLYMNVVSQNLYMPSVFKKLLKKIDILSLVPKFAWGWWTCHSNRRATPWPKFQRGLLQTLCAVSGAKCLVREKSLTGLQSPQTKHRKMADHGDFTWFYQVYCQTVFDEQTETICYAFPQLPHVASSFVSRVAVRSWSWKDMKSFICRARAHIS